jgi:hypothetical protein
MPASKDTRATRIGIAVLRVLVLKIVENIPIYGTVVSVSVDIYNAVKEELDKEQAVTKQDIADALKTLSPVDAANVVDSALKSARAQKATSTLSQKQLIEIRKQLIMIPSDIDRILADIERQEKQDVFTDSLRIQREQDAEIQSLQSQVEADIRNRNYSTAYKTVKRMLVIRPKDKDVIKLEEFVHARLKFPMPVIYLFSFMSFAMAILLFGINSAHHKPSSRLSESLMVLLYLSTPIIISVIVGLVAPRVWPRMSFRARSISTALITILFCILSFAFLIYFFASLS